MEIQDIKSKHTLAQVLHYYHLKPDKNLRLCCPFHDDKTPSMQVYYKTHTAFCFSSNCKTHGKAVDALDFIMLMENITKHEAIKKAVEMIGGETKPMDELTRSAVLTKMFTYFKNAIANSPQAKEYIKQRHLDYEKMEIGYNSGQFHHGKRRDEDMIKSCIKYGLLLDLNTKGRTGEAAYSPFGKWCIVFAMRNQVNQITGLYFRSTLTEKDTSTGSARSQRHFYLKDRQGLYPHYPKAETKKLILTESIIDAASLMMKENIKNNYEILTLYGTNGLSENTGLKVVYRKVKAEPKSVQWFYGVDPLASKFPSQSPYNYVENNPIRYIDPTGAYKIDPMFAKSHPGLVKLINYVLPQLANNVKVRDAWTRETGLSNQDFYNMVTPGQGPWLTPSVSNPKDPYAHGPYTDEKTQTGFNRGEMGVDYKNNIFLGPDDSGLAKFESGFSQAMQSCDPSCVEESMFVLSMAIVHESGHWGVLNNPKAPDGGRDIHNGGVERGSRLEYKAFRSTWDPKGYRDDNIIGTFGLMNKGLNIVVGMMTGNLDLLSGNSQKAFVKDPNQP